MIRKYHGDRLTPAEAAHLLARAAGGEVLTHLPVKTGTGYELRHAATLTPAERADVQERTADVAALLAFRHVA